MEIDAEDANKAASLVQEARRDYEKASEDLKAARQENMDAQVAWRSIFFSFDVSKAWQPSHTFHHPGHEAAACLGRLPAPPPLDFLQGALEHELLW